MSTEDLEGAPECQEPWPRATGKVDNRKPEHTFPLAAPNPANGTWNPNRAFSPHPSAPKSSLSGFLVPETTAT